LTDPTKDDGDRTATKQDVDSAKNEVLTAIRNGERATRAHIGSEIETMRTDVGHAKNFGERTLRAIKRFLNRMGMGTDDL
jgi:hypothetical protein